MPSSGRSSAAPRPRRAAWMHRGGALRASTRYAARTTSGSASGWTWRIRYGSRRSIGPALASELALDDLAQHRQRQRARSRTTSWKRRCRSASPRRSRASARSREDLQLAELVGQRLAGPADVSVDLVRDVVLAQRRVLGHEVDGLLPGPAQRVHAGVDDQRDARQASKVSTPNRSSRRTAGPSPR